MNYLDLINTVAYLAEERGVDVWYVGEAVDDLVADGCIVFEGGVYKIRK